ncbi:alpha/beta hydrolase family protein [Aureliella helgolandensis]|uniref:Alpha/beta hydrolase family protein n=1 Tax=Aureliella helgolandensis TaxID=2527968 RepID=A0A518GHK1_9BACT|nr:alpha/beta fold hydrolase [Aureliella helgolandensis]QDV28048.1 Alpha/beta hydrolase family protein [Aureliella helgolandensis]
MSRRSERVAFPGGNGHELAGILDLPDSLPLGTALFTHCFTCNKDLKAIVRISRGLAEAGYLVLRYDLTGLGQSQGDFAQTSFSTNRADLLAAVSFLATNYTSPDFLIGHSFGAACSLSLAQQIDSVRGVVSVAAPSETHHLADLLQKMDPSISPTSPGSVSIGGREFTIPQSMLDDFRQYDLSAALHELTKPTLLFHSPVDETLAFAHVERIYELLVRRDANTLPPAPTSLICLDGADHLLTRFPHDIPFVIATMAAWFNRQIA